VTMSNMLSGADSFNQPLEFSDTGNVKDMSGMFAWCKSFNQPLAFDTRSVELMTSMFKRCSKFNQPIAFDTTNVRDARQMFYGATSFAQVVAFDGISDEWADESEMFTGSKGSLRSLGGTLKAADVQRVAKDGTDLPVPRRYTHGQDGTEFDDDAVCQLCSERAAVWGTPCGHIYCGACMADWVSTERQTNKQRDDEPEDDSYTKPRCPTCRAPFDPDKLMQVLYFGSTRRTFYLRKALAHLRVGGAEHCDRARHHARTADRGR
jgi:hypothetical protein